jgi:hypothetical protein
MMKSFSYELELLSPVTSFFERKGCIVHREIQIGFCRADIVAFTPEQKVVSVELKLSDWKKALIQAKNYQLASDFVYVAFPLSKSYNVLKKARHLLKKNGIGFLVIHEESQRVCKIIDATQSHKKLGTISLAEIQKMKQTSLKKKPWLF